MLRGNNNAEFVEESAPGLTGQGTRSWETSAFSRKLLLVCELKGMGNYCRSVAHDVYPWTAYANSDGFLVAEAPTPISLN